MRGVVQSLRVMPSRFEGQTVIDWTVEVPGAVRGASFVDGAGDAVETIALLGPVEEVVIDVTGVVETVDLAGVLRGHREAVPPEAYIRSTRATRTDLAISELAEAVAEAAGTGSALDIGHGLLQAVADKVAYEPGVTAAHTTAAEALAEGRGVCQDHAHIMIAAARALELPARYVSGYLFAGEGDARAEASHAWTEIFVGDLGWVGFDASNRCCPDERYIRLGSGLDAQDGAPIRGVAQGAGSEELYVDVDVAAVQQ